MKKSSNLLLGFLALIIVGMFVVNVILKDKIDKQLRNGIETVRIDNSTTSSTDSVAMDSAISNE